MGNWLPSIPLRESMNTTSGTCTIVLEPLLYTIWMFSFLILHTWHLPFLCFLLNYRTTIPGHRKKNRIGKNPGSNNAGTKCLVKKQKQNRIEKKKFSVHLFSLPSLLLLTLQPCLYSFFKFIFMFRFFSFLFVCFWGFLIVVLDTFGTKLGAQIKL